MKGFTASLSAQATAVMRGLETHQPKEMRLFDDPVTRPLLSPVWRGILAFYGLPLLGQALLALRENRYPGILGNLYCRTRYIDDALHTALQEGLDQLVVLGAGFDSRAYRIHGIENTSVFEVDHPTTVAAKGTRLTKLFGRLPAHVTLVPIDFNQQKLDEAMSQHGYRCDLRTFFIWEGVTQYIQAEAVEDTLRFVRKTAALGSNLVFTYILREIIDGTSDSDVGRRIAAMTRRVGADWIFGLDPNDLPGYLAEQGFTLIEHAGAETYQERYLEPIGRELNLFEGERIVLARVARGP